LFINEGRIWFGGGRGGFLSRKKMDKNKEIKNRNLFSFLNLAIK
jgi:hypothetical protein